MKSRKEILGELIRDTNKFFSAYFFFVFCEKTIKQVQFFFAKKKRVLGHDHCMGPKREEGSKNQKAENRRKALIKALKKSIRIAKPVITSKPWFIVKQKEDKQAVTIYIYENNLQKDQICSLFEKKATAFGYDVLVKIVSKSKIC